MKVAINGTNIRQQYQAKTSHQHTAATRRFAMPSPGYIFGEYIWGTMVLVLSVVSRMANSINVSMPLKGIDNSFVKRCIDIFGALVGLTLTAPLFLILPILIKLDSPGPVFYKQLRTGHNRRRGQRRVSGVSDLGRCNRDRRRQNLHGRPFEVIKFRTMVADAEKKCGAVWATKNDPRITTLGHIMRKTRMDEIPQFLNILIGDMSLVGPRPERPVFVEELSEKVENYKKRLDVKPGLTGLAQVENGYDSSIASVVKKVQYDLQYIRNWSVWQDVKIMLKTVVVVVTGKGAF
ncbi:MAG: sugar transferase [Candidatus Zixiibacteriota bacterium]